MSTNKQIEKKTDPYVALRYLGVAEIVAYVGLFVWLCTFMGTFDWFSTFAQFFVLTYLAALATLLPSVFAFIYAPTARNPEKIKTAKTLQKTLFIQVCVALVPSMALASSVPVLLIACFLGFIFFGVMLTFTKPILASIQTLPAPTYTPVNLESPQSLHQGLYCATCGSPLGAQGLCPKCG